MFMKRELYVTNRNDWRAWLEKNHNVAKEVWLIYYKKHVGKPGISYEASVEEALCFGWVDSIIKRLMMIDVLGSLRLAKAPAPGLSPTRGG
jgi:uncharacterized protein YdeI (YjbR/CyaY-like superfamily)